MTTHQQDDIIAFLSARETHGQTAPVEIRETHGSIVFLTATHAYKLKRAVKFPYMDYSTPARRKTMCLREFAINSRIAPALYLGVKGILRITEHLAFGGAADSKAIEWVVVMKRFPDDALLQSRLATRSVSPADMISVAETISAFHDKAEVIPTEDGITAMRAVIAENLSIFRQSPENFPDELVSNYEELTARFLEQKARVFEERAREGFVRRCHGDLHLNNVCFMDEKPVLFDAIEFNDSFSFIDVGFDLAYILMDLSSHRYWQWANLILNRYLERTRDYGLLDILPLFLANRAAIKAHVVHSQRRLKSESHADPNVRELLSSAISYLKASKPTLVAVGGLSGSGKSSVARGLVFQIGLTPGGILLRTDVIRKAMLGVSDLTRLPTSAYDATTNEMVYSKLRELASQALNAGYSVVADAVFGTSMEREAMEAVAQASGARFVGIWLHVTPEIAEERIAQRKNDASDANTAVLTDQIASITAPAAWHKIDTSPQLDEVIEQVRRIVG